MEVKHLREPQLSPSLTEDEFRKKMIERIKSNFADILDQEDHQYLEMGTTGLDLILKKYFPSNQ